MIAACQNAGDVLRTAIVVCAAALGAARLVRFATRDIRRACPPGLSLTSVALTFRFTTHSRLPAQGNCCLGTRRNLLVLASRIPILADQVVGRAVARNADA